MINLILADDHIVVRDGIKIILESEKCFRIVGEAYTGNEVLHLIENGVKVDIVLADINMPDMDGLSLIKELQERYPEVKIVILSMLNTEKSIAQSFADGASGYLLKSIGADELFYAINHVYNGGKFLSSELSLYFVEKAIRNPNVNFPVNVNNEFTSREIEVLQLISEGMTNYEMSEKLFLSKRTIEGHRQNLIEKTNSRNTAALIRFAVLNGFLQ